MIDDLLRPAVSYLDIPPTVFDELPLWSAPFGLALLDEVPLLPHLVALDVGCGTGFPLIELAQRLGPAAHVHGVDPWTGALARAREKLAVLGLQNVTLHEAHVEALPLDDASVDLIVSNNGLNNVADRTVALAECARVAKPDAAFVCAYNLPGTMHELYGLYDELLAERDLAAERQALAEHIAHKREPIAQTTGRLEAAGFHVERVVEHHFRMRFADARALFAHFFVRTAFVPAWLEIVAPEVRAELFPELGQRLDTLAREHGELALSVPFACVRARRVAQ